MTDNIQSSAAWDHLLDWLATLGATDRAYGQPDRPDVELWERAVQQCEVPAEPDPLLLAQLRQAYQSADGKALIPMDLLAQRLGERGHDSAFVERTGSNCAMVYVGPKWRDHQGDERWAVAVGPGGFHGPRFTDPFADRDEFFVGPDENDMSDQFRVPPCATLDDIAELVDLQVKASAVMAEMGRVMLRIRRRGVIWGEPLSDELCEALQELPPAAVGGESDWNLAVYLYELAEPVDTWAGQIPAGTYLRTIEGKTVRAAAVTGAARGFVQAIEDEMQLDELNPR
jgi:hypothetical protein